MSEQFQVSFVFINSNDSMMASRVISDAQPLIKLPFPPMIDPHDLIVSRPDGREPSKAPNAFIIYRKLFNKTAKDNGYTLPMSVISPIASKSWEQESEMVKNEYRRIAREAFLYRSEICPKPKREGKKRWNIVSFAHSEQKTSRKVKSQKSIDTTSTPTLPSQISENELTSTKPTVNSPISDLDLFDDWENFLYPHPNLPTEGASGNNTPKIDSPQTFVETKEQRCDDIVINAQHATFDDSHGIWILDPKYLNNFDTSLSSDFYELQPTFPNSLDVTSVPADLDIPTLSHNADLNVFIKIRNHSMLLYDLCQYVLRKA
ncbi:7058_t:CDS:2 [Acaulospora colombiana]|uniref:7058_t:CDS:1 n=1 Tax=Acaulospora colombiana TaxID=27376 RepID=A0ACA9JX84_9GLOM|nr:7058_t:CDS:2 [Acaulospora colombiana]